MDVQFYGANCVVLTSKQARVVIDDTLADLGVKSVTREGDICLFTGAKPATIAAGPKLIIDMPGEYEASNVSITGIQVRAHMDEEKQRNGVMYKITWGETKYLITGHAFPKLSEAELEMIGIVDVMFVPVGGNGYTLDATGALQLIKQVEPKVVVPTHYADNRLKYEVPQTELEDALKTLSMETKQAGAKFQFKPAEVSGTTEIVVIDTTK